MAPTFIRSKPALARLAADLIGADVVVDLRPETGWPALLRLVTTEGIRQVALHVSNIGTHSRKPYERRFQNPGAGTPATAPLGWLPLLVGVSLGPPPLLVVTDGRPRVGIATRYPVLFHERVLREAASFGWSEYVSTTDEKIYGMHPRLLPIVVEMLVTGGMASTARIAASALASGLLDDDTPAAADRARRAASVLVRAAAFSLDVRKAYNNHCAMCGLGIGLVEGAHILPASAPGSHDKVWNGVALCRNHHRLFDTHRVWIEPSTFEVKQHPKLLERAVRDPIVANLTNGTWLTLRAPSAAADQPRSDMINYRRAFYSEKYDWL